MIKLEELRASLQHMNLGKVAAGAGVHYNALYRLYKGGTKPSYETVQKVVDFLEKNKI